MDDTILKGIDSFSENENWQTIERVNVSSGGRMGYGIFLCLGRLRGEDENSVALKIAIEDDPNNSEGDWVLLTDLQIEGLIEKLSEMRLFLLEPLGGQGMEAT